MSQTASPQLTPVAPESRIVLLDILRGFALFGVLWSNLNDHYGTTEAANGLDRALAWIQQWLIEERFYTLLGFLFGIGFAIQLRRADARDADARNIFVRKMFVLLIIGVLHGLLIWRGDILTEYALLGFLLLAYRKLSTRGLLLAAAATYVGLQYLVKIGFGLTQMTYLFRRPPNPLAAWAYAHGSYTQVMPIRVQEYLAWYETWGFVVFPAFLTLFVLGLWAERTGVLSRVRESRWVGRAFWIAVACAVVALLIGDKVYTWWPFARPTGWRDFHFWTLRDVVVGIPDRLLVWGSSAAYALGLTFLALRPRAARVLAPLGAVGRMTLTTYLTQSVVCTLLFYGYGLGWYGRVGFTGMFAITVVLFACQLAASAWWTRRFRFGPVEWFWRSLAYGRKQPMTSAAPSGSAVLP